MPPTTPNDSSKVMILNNATRRKPMLDVPRNVVIKKEKPHKRRAPPRADAEQPASDHSEASSVTDNFPDSPKRQNNNDDTLHIVQVLKKTGVKEVVEKVVQVQEEEQEPEPDTKELLAYASMRVSHQKLKDDYKNLKSVLKHKDEQIGQLTAQLRRATASKCDLVVACTEMERQMESSVKHGDGTEAHRKYLEILEGRADMEREFMNELQALTNQLLGIDRKYLNELCDKDFTIGQLQEQNRRLDEELHDIKDKQKIKERTQAVRMRMSQNSLPME